MVLVALVIFGRGPERSLSLYRVIVEEKEDRGVMVINFSAFGSLFEALESGVFKFKIISLDFVKDVGFPHLISTSYFAICLLF